MARAAIMKASAIFSSAVFSLVVGDDVDVVVVGNEDDVIGDGGFDEVVLLLDRVAHVAATDVRIAIDILMKEASRPFPHHVVGSAFRKHWVSFGICGKMPSHRSRSFWSTAAPAVFVRASAIMSPVGQYLSSTVPASDSSASRAARTAKYLVLQVPPSSATRKALLLSTKSKGVSRLQDHSSSRALSPSTICHPVAAALTSASQVERAEEFCREDLQRTTDPAHVITTPVWLLVGNPAKLASL